MSRSVVGSGRPGLSCTGPDGGLRASEGAEPARRPVFTSALVEGLATGDADRDRDGLVALDELYDYIYDKVRTATPNQTPGKWAHPGAAAARAPGSDRQPARRRPRPGADDNRIAVTAGPGQRLSRGHLVMPGTTATRVG